MHDLPLVISSEKNQCLATTRRFLLSVLYKGNVRVISGNADVSEYVNFQILDLLIEVGD